MSLRINSYADLFVPDPPPPPAHVNDPHYPYVVKEYVGLTAGGMETQKHCIQGGKKAGYYGCSLSLEKTARISNEWHRNKKVI